MTDRTAQAYYRNGHGDDPVLLQSPGDVDALIDTFCAIDPTKILAVLHSMDRPLISVGVPGHEWLVGIDGEAQVGLLAFMDDGNWVRLSP